MLESTFFEFDGESPCSRGGCGIVGVASIGGEERREVVEMALSAGENIEHRGGSIGDRADGGGIMVRTPQDFFRRFIEPGSRLPDDERLMVGNIWFLPEMGGDTLRLLDALKDEVIEGGFMPLGLRDVPVNDDKLSFEVKKGRPRMWQILMGKGMIPSDRIAKEMYLLRNKIGGRFRGVYLPSFVPDTVVYKGLSTVSNLSGVFPDLDDPDFKTSAAVAHRRYSTNTTPKFLLAQPFSCLAHNGEINTNRANVNAVEDFERALNLFYKVLMRQGSDSANLDRMVELFLANGISLSETLRRFMMPSWRDFVDLPADHQAYYEGVRRALGNLAVMEGPAAVVAMDGREMVVGLDKMGLRPVRFMQTRDGFFVVSSEMGAVPVRDEHILLSGQLDPGEILLVDTKTGEIFYPDEAEVRTVANTPINFRQLSNSKIFVPESSALKYEFEGKLDDRLAYFGWSLDRKRAVLNILKQGGEPIVSMGHGWPLAVLSQNRPTLFKYFKQIIAVVTNPSIDPIREKGAFDLTTYLGRRPRIEEVRHSYAVYPQYKLETPFLTDSELSNMIDRSGHQDVPKVEKLDMVFDRGRPESIKEAIANICDQALALVKGKRAQIIVLSDRHANGETLPLPSLLIISAVNKVLRQNGLRRNVSLVVDTGEVEEAHDAAVLFAHGADAVNPYMMWHIAYAEGDGFESEHVRKLREILDIGLRKIMSKMGITTLDGYRDSQLFEAVGIDPAVIAYYLTGTQSHIGGIGINEIYEDICRRADGFSGLSRNRDKSVYRKEVYSALQQVARGEDADAYKKFLEVLDLTPPTYLRDLLKFKFAEVPISLDRVIPERDIIVAVFRGAAMSHGALNRLAHMAIAAAFNFFNSYSNSGEGGELSSRNKGEKYEEARSRIRQVASGRFGVDAEYLMNSDEIQIKIGQGAKPGEGGHLPADKVTAEIASIRKTKEGVSLISPPPHHNIYSIEDLSQLVYNLKQVNPKAFVSIKVPAVTNLGTIAIGLVKAGADVIEVSCFSGGTGAACESSIEHAGLPLERSLTEVHQVLTENGVRNWVKLRADGGIKSGMDVAKLVALGANEVSFGSALMVAEMCVMCRGCSKGKCPVGIARHDEDGVKRFMAKVLDPEENDSHSRYLEAKKGIENYLKNVASEFREILAKLHMSTPEELRGRVDLLEQVRSSDARHSLVNLSGLIREVSVFKDREIVIDVRDRMQCRVDQVFGGDLNNRIISDLSKGNRSLNLSIGVQDRAVGSKLAGMIASGAIKVPEGGFEINLKGYAGQALGFAAVSGMKIRLVGYANDSVGEVMSGSAKIVIRQPDPVDGDRSKNSIIGNAACYGATGGVLYAEGMAGQRLGVRNSGATIVTEGAGKYAFEYMTGGIGVVLGEMREVVGAGMTGGIVFSRDVDIERKIHAESVQVQELKEKDAVILKSMLEDYFRETSSPLAMALLEKWDESKGEFKKIIPKI